MKKKTSSSRENLNLILDDIIISIQNGQDEIFELSENMHRELEVIQSKIEDHKKNIVRLDREIEVLLEKEQEKRKTLYIVSRDFLEYGEDDIKAAYEEANDIHIQCVLKKEERRTIEKNLQELIQEVASKQSLIEQAERLMSRIKSIIDFLMTDLTYVGDRLTSLEEKTQIGIRIIRGQEEERRRIARDIHDGPAQDIASLILKSDITRKILRAYPDEAEEELKLMKRHLQSVLRDIRSIMYDLRPTMIDDLGLIAAISSMASDVSEEHKIEVNIYDDSRFEVRSSAVGLVVYRIIQESLNNAVKHAKARHISIKIDIKKDMIEGSIIDDGCGFDVRLMDERKRAFGLSSMKERANIIQGSVKVESEEGVGTKVVFKIPNEEEIYEK